MDINNDINLNKIDINNTESKQLEHKSDVQERESAGEDPTNQALQAQDAYGRGLVNVKANIPPTQQVQPQKIETPEIKEDITSQVEETKEKPNILSRSFNSVKLFLRKQHIKNTLLLQTYWDKEIYQRLDKIFEYPDLLDKYPEQLDNKGIKEICVTMGGIKGFASSLDAIRKHSDTMGKNTILKNKIKDLVYFDSGSAKLDSVFQVIKENQSTLDNSPNKDKVLDLAITNYPKENIPVLEKFIQHPELLDNENFLYEEGMIPPIEQIITSNSSTDKELGTKYKCEIIDKFINDKEYFEKHPVIAEHMPNLIAGVTDETYDYIKEILDHPEVGEKNPEILSVKWGYSDMQELASYAKYLYQNFDKLELTPKEMNLLVFSQGEINLKQVKQLKHALGKEKFEKLSHNDTYLAAKLVGLVGVKNINEIPQQAKKDVLRSLVGYNEDLFKVSDTVKELLPLIPKNQEEYCELLPAIVRSLGVETNILKPEQVDKFNKSMTKLSDTLSNISDKDFNDMTISQEITREDFIKTVREKTKDLSRTERQKVYDYYGFELHHTKKNSTGFTITGYAVNLNNGKKLAQITDSKTKEVVESLRPDVIKYSTDNKITSNNPQVAELMTEFVSSLPELRTMIGKAQHGNGTNHGHDFDVMKHSLKVMQKISQDENFKTLNDSDKKIMLLASLMHDITKSEGHADKTHANESAFDTFYITKKFNLTKAEQNKLYSLIKHHEWLAYANTSNSDKELTKRLQSVAFDLQQYNLVDMAEIFTHADLKAVKQDDSFHDRSDGDARKRFDGTQHSFGDSATEYMTRIKGYVKELKATQPLLPTTKMPSASTIEKAITQVNSDGSTNIKGVYKDKDGLVIVKFNEVENWEQLGLSKGSTSKGYDTTAVTSKHGKVIRSKETETGNIKFFVHGLDFPNQLVKFDAFATPDSDALLSVSYAERPETKYRFFRPQGVILDIPADYVYGGGETDAGSGCGKDIQKFKDEYIFGGHRESDRKYISNLIKEATGMNDDEYIEFVEQNKDKPMTEIEPKEIREKIISKFGAIGSNLRGGEREYNEMYASNPEKIMGVFVYDVEKNSKIKNPIEFLNRTTKTKGEKAEEFCLPVAQRTEFLRQYALEHDVPMYIFGD